MMNPSFTEFEEMIKDLFDTQNSFDHTSVESWTSMQSLIAVSAIDEHYDVLISHDELKSARSLVELHAVLKHKLA